METEQLMDEIDLILKTSKAGTMSTSVSPAVSEYMTFYIKDYALYTETEKNSPIINGIGHDPLVHITLGGDEQSDNHLEIIGETEVVTDREIIDWLAQEKGSLTVAADMVMIKVMTLKVKQVKMDSVEATNQDDDKETYLLKRTPEDDRIDWSAPAEEVHRLIRATSRPYPGAFSYYRDHKVTIWRASVHPNAHYIGIPGQIISSNPLVIDVLCTDGILRIEDYGMEGLYQFI